MPWLEVSHATAAALALDSLAGTRNDECQQLYTSSMQQLEEQYAKACSLQPDTSNAAACAGPTTQSLVSSDISAERQPTSSVSNARNV